MPSSSFADLGVSASVVDALRAGGITVPMPVQRLVIEHLLAGSDVMVKSPTGSGKTLAFGLPLIERTAAQARRPAALVLAPTRELAAQIVDELREPAHAKALAITAVYGGTGLARQSKLAPRAHILVATPGRLQDLLDRGDVTLAHVRTLVLDEADRMLDMGFRPAVDRIVRLVPAQRQTVVLSATLDGEAGRLAETYTVDAQRCEHAPPAERTAEIEHRFVRVAHEAKLETLVRVLDGEERGRTLVFVRTKRGADRLAKRLARNGVDAVAMHGDRSQSQRERALARFESGDVHTLVATDVAARGIDVRDVTHVINYDAPPAREDYIHRVGRTGRAGATGVGITFVMADQARDMAGIARELRLEPEFAGAGFARSERPAPDRSSVGQQQPVPARDQRPAPQRGQRPGRSATARGPRPPRASATTRASSRPS
ncbi:MAG: DEAD/DEAH box helicase, partial [Actinomycetota bacterium]|nr:DEAD/DEAH box helicase [Actinomycetota bacterium]